MDLLNNKVGSKIEGFCLIKTFDKKTARNGSIFIDLLISDKGGDLSAKIWDYDPLTHDRFASGMLVKIRGTLSQYNGADQISVNLIREITPEDNVNMDDFVLGAPYSEQELYDSLIQMVEGFKNKDFKLIVSTLLKEKKEELLMYPAAVRMHHAMRGGLIYHTMSVLELAKVIAKIYPFVDEELLISGAILHDIAKCEEYVVNDVGSASEYTPQGILIGHLVRGAMYVEQIASANDISRENAMVLEHLILSHHGIPDFGSAVKPAMIEAEILSMVDMMDAKVFQIAEALGKVQQGQFTDKLWGLESRKFYKYALFTDTKAIIDNK